MGDQNHPRIQFDALIRDYLENLNITLRAFKSAEEFEFLSTFVPSDDPTSSLLELVELARDGNVANLTVVVNPTTLSQIDLKKVTMREPTCVQHKAGDQTELQFNIAGR